MKNRRSEQGKPDYGFYAQGNWHTPHPKPQSYHERLTQYEREKAILCRAGLAPDEYTKEARYLAAKWGV